MHFNTLSARITAVWLVRNERPGDAWNCGRIISMVRSSIKILIRNIDYDYDAKTSNHRFRRAIRPAQLPSSAKRPLRSRLYLVRELDVTLDRLCGLTADERRLVLSDQCPHFVALFQRMQLYCSELGRNCVIHAPASEKPLDPGQLKAYRICFSEGLSYSSPYRSAVGKSQPPRNRSFSPKRGSLRKAPLSIRLSSVLSWSRTWLF